MERHPEKAREVLSSIEASSRQAVVELHRLLGFLRRAGQPDELAPQPDLAQLPELVAQAGQGGLAVELSVEGEPRALPPTLEVSAYRVIQEALTNALKHSGGTTATVRVDYQATALEIEVLDDGRGTASSPGSTGGHGLMGMRERVGLHGGHLRAGRHPARRLRRARDLSVERQRDVTARIVLADDQPLVRAGFRMILEAEDDIDVVGEASDGEEAVAVTRQLQPDVVLMDIQMPKVDGLEATRRIAQDAEHRQSHPHPHHLRARRLRLRGPARGRQRLHAQKRRTRRPRARRARRGDR